MRLICRTSIVLAVVVAALACGDSTRSPDGGRMEAGVDTGVAPMDAGEPLATAGEPCSSDEECVTGECFTEAERPDIPRGQCIRSCREDVPEDCPEGTICIVVGRAICQPACTSTSDCDPGRLCFPDQPDVSRKYCLPSCWKDEHCESGVCDPWTGMCVDELPPSGGGSWASCSSDAECRSDYCDTYVDACAVFCPYDVSGQVCPEPDEVCVNDLGLDTVGTCRPACTDGSDCDTGRCGLVDGQSVCN